MQQVGPTISLNPHLHVHSPLPSNNAVYTIAEAANKLLQDVASCTSLGHNLRIKTAAVIATVVLLSCCTLQADMSLLLTGVVCTALTVAGSLSSARCWSGF